MKKFNNHFAIGLGKSMKPIKILFFTLSSIGSAIAIGFILLSAFGVSPSFNDSPISFIICFSLALCVALGVDFFLIGRAGKFGFAEIFAWSSGYFYFDVFRKIAAVFMLSVGIVGISVSLVSSWYGSEMAATLSIQAPENTHGETVKSQRAETVKAVKPYREAVKAVKAEIAKEAASKTSNKLKTLAKRKNDEWAKGEIAKIEQRVKRKYKSKLEAAETALSDAIERENKYSSTVISASLATAEKAEQNTESKVAATSLMIKILGVLPLLLGVVLQLAEVIGLVSSQIPEEEIKRKREQKERQAKAGQRSGDLLEGMCTENINPS